MSDRKWPPLPSESEDAGAERPGGRQSFTLDGDSDVAARHAAAIVARRGSPLPHATAPAIGREGLGTVRSRMRKLTSIGRDLTRLTDRRAILGRITSGACDLLGSQATVAVMATSDGRLELYRSKNGAAAERLDGEPGPLDERVIGRIRRELGGEPLSVPIAESGRIQGLLATARPDGSAPAPDDVWLLDAVADQAAVALRTADEAAQRAEEVRTAADAALSDDETRDRAMSRIAHDLRTPLLTFQLGCNLIEDAPGDEGEIRRLLRQMRLAAEHLEVVAENLLHVGQISAGLLQTESHPLDVGETVEAALGVVRLAAGERDQSIQFECEPGLTAHADGRRLRQVLVNLLGNAVKFSPKGARIQVDADLAGENRVRIVVKDEGPGVPPDQAEAIFQPYYRMDETSTVEGSGLGLAISQDLIRRMEGEISVDAAENGGASFAVTLPRRDPRTE